MCSPLNVTRFEVPLHIHPDPSRPKHPLYEVELSSYPFSFRVIRRSNGAVIYDTDLPGSLVFEDQYLQLAAK